MSSDSFEDFGIEILPDELLCYIFTFLHKANQLQIIAQVSTKWNEALSYEEIWKANYFKFYGIRRTRPKIGWRNAFIQRKGLAQYQKIFSKTVKLEAMDNRMKKLVLIGGAKRNVLLHFKNTVELYSLALKQSELIFEEKSSYIYSSDDASLVAMADNVGKVYVRKWDEFSEKYGDIKLYSDGNNVQDNFNLSVVMISSYKNFMAVLAENRTISIWDTDCARVQCAHNLDREERKELRDVIKTAEEYDSLMDQIGNNPEYAGTFSRPPRYEETPGFKATLGCELGCCLIQSLALRLKPSLIYIPPIEDLHVVFATGSNKIIVWRYGNVPVEFTGHSDKIIRIIGWQREGRNYLVSYGLDSKLMLWDIDQGELLSNIGAASVQEILYVPEYDYLFVRGEKTLCLNGSDLYHEFSLPGCTCLAVYSKKHLIFLGQETGAIRVYYIHTRQFLGEFRGTRSNQYFSIFSLAIDKHNIISVDDFCIHWRLAEKYDIEYEAEKKKRRLRR